MGYPNFEKFSFHPYNYTFTPTNNLFFPILSFLSFHFTPTIFFFGMQFFSDQNFKPEHLKKILKHYTLWLKYKIWIHSCFFNRNNHTNYSGSHIYRNTHPLFSGLWTLRYSYPNNHKMFFGLIKKLEESIGGVRAVDWANHSS
jgi:hypothetical protein